MVESPKDKFNFVQYLLIRLPSVVSWESEVDPLSPSQSVPSLAVLAFECSPDEMETGPVLTVKSQHIRPFLPCRYQENCILGLSALA